MVYSRRRVVRAIEREPAVDLIPAAAGSAILVAVASARREVDLGRQRLEQISRMVASDPEILRGTPVYRGTRIPVDSIASMLAQGAGVDELLEGYPSLTRDQIEMAAVLRRGIPFDRSTCGATVVPSASGEDHQSSAGDMKLLVDEYLSSRQDWELVTTWTTRICTT